LSDREKAWLDKFTTEYTNAGKLTKEHKPLHKTKALKKDCYDRNNSRNRCQWTRQKASIGAKYLEDNKSVLVYNSEEDLIKKIDQEVFGHQEEVELSEVSEKKVVLRRSKD
jgi:hypothetical protein